MTHQQVLEELKSGKYQPVYFLQGDEPFFIDQISGYIEKHALDESQKSFNQIIVYGRDVSANDVLNHARRFPMMSERQVVIVKEAQNLGDLSREKGNKLFEGYFANPQPSTILVFCYKGKTLDKRKTLSKTLEKNAVVVTAKRIYDNQVPGWISDYFSTRNYTITPKAIRMLSDHIGNNLERLANEINKIFLNLQEGGEVDETIVEKFVGISKDYNVFEFQNALMHLNRPAALRIAGYFGENLKRTPLVQILGVLHSMYSKLLLVHSQRNGNEKALAGKLRVNPYFVQDYVQAARNIPVNNVIRNINAIREADLQVKGISNASISDDQILKELTARLLM